MPVTQIVNASSAFNEPYPSQSISGVVYIELVAGVALSAGQGVGINASQQAIVSTAATSSRFVGVSLDTVIAGQVVRVVTQGIIANALADGSGVTAGNIVTPVATGTFSATPSTTIGTNAGVALTTATAGLAFSMYVQKM